MDESTYLGKVSCLCCTKVFFSRAFHTHFQRIHLKTQSNFANQFAKGSLAAKQAANLLKERIFSEFTLNPKLCKFCSVPLPFEKWYKDKDLKFCNRSCSASFNNATRIVHDRKPIISSAPQYTKISFCCQCNKVFQRNYSKSSKTCSTICKNKLLSRIQQDRIESGWNPNLNRGRHKQSYLELAFSTWLEQENVQFTQEHPFKRFDSLGNYEKTYFVDFFFPTLNLIIELDGTQHKTTTEYDSERDLYISNNYNVKILRITHYEFVNKLRIEEISVLLGVGAGGGNRTQHFLVGSQK